jgi:hypothetical protein
MAGIREIGDQIKGQREVFPVEYRKKGVQLFL